ncbi:hypothetical protein SLS56_010543 [Neofusicoccum ribis]|uniref:Uncharacterized protein n=1 Tax=Neofusicoccum ribis TaxID=45134 RepID=A0ABR3SE52_9PEZI
MTTAAKDTMITILGSEDAEARKYEARAGDIIRAILFCVHCGDSASIICPTQEARDGLIGENSESLNAAVLTSYALGKISPLIVNFDVTKKMQQGLGSPVDFVRVTDNGLECILYTTCSNILGGLTRDFKWELNDWVTSKGKSVLHADEIRSCIGIIRDRNARAHPYFAGVLGPVEYSSLLGAIGHPPSSDKAVLNVFNLIFDGDDVIDRMGEWGQQFILTCDNPDRCDPVLHAEIGEGEPLKVGIVFLVKGMGHWQVSTRVMDMFCNDELGPYIRDRVRIDCMGTAGSRVVRGSTDPWAILTVHMTDLESPSYGDGEPKVYMTGLEVTQGSAFTNKERDKMISIANTPLKSKDWIAVLTENLTPAVITAHGHTQSYVSEMTIYAPVIRDRAQWTDCSCLVGSYFSCGPAEQMGITRSKATLKPVEGNASMLIRASYIEGILLRVIICDADDVEKVQCGPAHSIITLGEIESGVTEMRPVSEDGMKQALIAAIKLA